jgi:hypothetical protein
MASPLYERMANRETVSYSLMDILPGVLAFLWNPYKTPIIDIDARAGLPDS